MKEQYESLIDQAYKAFNERDVDSVTSLMSANVRWPNGWEGGYVSGTEEVREYWTRQWKEINPKVTPLLVTEREDGKVEVEVHQIVKDLQGKELFNDNVKHIYSFSEGLIESMEIEKS